MNTDYALDNITVPEKFLETLGENSRQLFWGDSGAPNYAVHFTNFSVAQRIIRSGQYGNCDNLQRKYKLKKVCLVDQPQIQLKWNLKVS